MLSRKTLAAVLWAVWQPFRLILKPSARELIARAIRERKQLVVRYKGAIRSVCPHVMGIGNGGRRKCLTYQFDGESGAGWRDLFVDEVEVIRIRRGRWHTEANYAGGGRSVYEVEVAI